MRIEVVNKNGVVLILGNFKKKKTQIMGLTPDLKPRFHNLTHLEYQNASSSQDE